jgi:hypothetical protein
MPGALRISRRCLDNEGVPIRIPPSKHPQRLDVATPAMVVLALFRCPSLPGDASCDRHASR